MTHAEFHAAAESLRSDPDDMVITSVMIVTNGSKREVQYSITHFGGSHEAMCAEDALEMMRCHIPPLTQQADAERRISLLGDAKQAA